MMQRIEKTFAGRRLVIVPGGGPFAEAVRQNTQVLLDTVGRLVQHQAEVWARSFAEAERIAVQAHAGREQALTAALEVALDRIAYGWEADEKLYVWSGPLA